MSNPTHAPTAVPPARRPGRTEQLLIEVRRMPLFRQVVPSEAGIGWPLPLRRDGHVYAVLPMYGMVRNKAGVIELFAPFSVLTVDWQSHAPVKYVNLQFERPAGFPMLPPNTPVGTFPHAAIHEWSVGQYEAARAELLSLYDDLFDALRTKTPPTPERNQRFGELLKQLMEPSLEPYYRALASSPGFLNEYLGTPKS